MKANGQPTKRMDGFLRTEITYSLDLSCRQYMLNTTARYFIGHTKGMRIYRTVHMNEKVINNQTTKRTKKNRTDFFAQQTKTFTCLLL